MQPSLIGKVLDGRYSVSSLLGESAPGVLYSAVDFYSGETVAVKVIPVPSWVDKTVFDTFRRETEGVASTGHPSLCRVRKIALATTAEMILVVMEPLEGEFLSSLLEKHVILPLKTAVTIAFQVLEGLEAAHAAGIAHRNLRPENVFIAGKNQAEVAVKIMDFGLSGFLAGGSLKNLMRRGALLGMPYCLSPEQVTGPPTTGVSSDVYAVGSLLFCMMTGKTPVEALSLRGLLEQIAEKPFPGLRDFDPRIPPALDDIVRISTARQPAERYTSARRMKQALVETGLCSTERSIAVAQIAGVTARGKTFSGSVGSTPAGRRAGGAAIFGRRWFFPAAAALTVLASIASGFLVHAVMRPEKPAAGEEAVQPVAGKAPTDLSPTVSIAVEGWRAGCSIRVNEKKLGAIPSLKIARSLLPADLFIECGGVLAKSRLVRACPDKVTISAPDASTAQAASPTAKDEDEVIAPEKTKEIMLLEPSRDDIRKAMGSVRKKVKACAAGVGGTAFMTVVFSGETGKAISAKVTGGDLKGTGQADCISAVVSKTSVPPFKKSTFVTTYSYDLAP
jgi:hypothetical protein